jgi:alpha-mannosidase
MCFYGVGNHGGGPTRRNVAAVAATQAEEHGWRAEFSSPEGYFDAAEACGADWPAVRDDLQHHARGCYTALARVKWENRRAEHALGAAERWASLAALLAGGADPRAALQAAWEPVLFNQFHDILAGTSIRAAYEDAWRAYDAALQTTDDIQSAAIGALGARLAVAERDQPVAGGNPVPWARREVAHRAVPVGGWEHDFTGGRFPGTPRVTDADGRLVDSQLLGVELENNTYIAHIAAQVEAPALGARVFYVALPEAEPPVAAPVPPLVETLENGRLRLQFNPRTGWLSSLLDLEDGAEYLGGPAGVLQVLDDPTDTWSHGLAAYSEVIGAFTASEPPRLIHDGPVQRTGEVRSAWGRSTAVQRYTLAAGSAVVDLEIEVDWREQLKMLKLALPLNLAAPQATVSAPYGRVVRPATGEEEPCQGWLDVSDAAEGGLRGLALLNDGQYGYDLTAAVLRLSLLRSPIYAFHEPRRTVPGVTYHYTDQGPHRFHCRLLPHAGGWDTARPAQASLALQEPLSARLMAPQAGQAAAFSLLRLDCPTAVLTTVKLAEDGGALIVRGHEAAGCAARLIIVSERLGRTWEHAVAPHEIWTLRLPFVGQAEALNLLEEPLA